MFGSGVFLGGSYMFRLKPMGEYARILAGVVSVRLPRLAVVIEKQFCN